ncbi:MAG: hypothetical protein K2V71_00725 [Methylotenera sp.]|nr:hypothetical protein [Methylotenera sp.]
MLALLESFLPTKLSQCIFWITATLSAGVLFSVELTQRIGLEVIWKNTPNQRLILLLIIISLGLFALVVSLLLHIKELNKPNIKKEIEPNLKKKLDQNKTDILVLLSNQDAQTTKQLSTSLNITEQLALFHLTELFNSKIITNTLFMDGRPVKWHLNQNGRAYLVSNNLL